MYPFIYSSINVLLFHFFGISYTCFISLSWFLPTGYLEGKDYRGRQTTTVLGKFIETVIS